MRPVKFAFPLVAFLACGLAACNTVENRRSLYSPAKPDGPYTRSLREGTWKHRKTVDQEYAEAQAKKRKPQLKASRSGTAPPASGEPPAPLPE